MVAELTYKLHGIDIYYTGGSAVNNTYNPNNNSAEFTAGFAQTPIATLQILQLNYANYNNFIAWLIDPVSFTSTTSTTTTT